MNQNRDFSSRYDPSRDKPRDQAFVYHVSDTIESLLPMIESWASGKGAKFETLPLRADVRRDLQAAHLSGNIGEVVWDIRINPSMHDTEFALVLWPFAHIDAPSNPELGHPGFAYSARDILGDYYHVSPEPEKVRTALDRAYQLIASQKRASFRDKRNYRLDENISTVTATKN